MESLVAGVRVAADELIDDVIYELVEDLPNTFGAPTGVVTADEHEVRFDGPTVELDALRERLDSGE